jgi:hypothetical protein
MIRTKVKGTKFKAASNPEHEPNFYHMPPVVVVTPHSSDCDHSENDGCSSGNDSYSKRSSEPSIPQNQTFQPPHCHFENSPHCSNATTVQPHEPPKSIMVDRLAIQIFGSDFLEMPPSPQMSSHILLGSPILPYTSREFDDVDSMYTAPFIPLVPSNEYLDEAIDDLFLDDSQASNEVMDFVNAWDEEFGNGQFTDGMELGKLLDKILED